MFEVAAEHDLIDHNPVRKKLHRPRHTHKKMPIWSAENVQKILLDVPVRWRAVFWCFTLTGVRVGELLALQWKVSIGTRRRSRFLVGSGGPATGIYEDRPGAR
jgi:integrase